MRADTVSSAVWPTNDAGLFISGSKTVNDNHTGSLLAVAETDLQLDVAETNPPPAVADAGLLLAVAKTNSLFAVAST